MNKASQLGLFILISVVLISGSALIYGPSNQVTGQVVVPFDSIPDPGDIQLQDSGLTTTAVSVDLGGGWVRYTLLGIEANPTLRQELIDNGMSSTQAEAITTRGIGVRHPAGEVQGLAELTDELNTRLNAVERAAGVGPIRIEGELCTTTAYCIEGLNCVSNICQAPSRGSACNFDFDCGQGLRCINNACSTPPLA